MKEEGKLIFSALIIAILLFIQSCAGIGYAFIPQSQTQGFDFCYDGKDTGVDSLIRIDGYYEIVTVRYESYKDTDMNGYPYRKQVDTLVARKDSSMIVFFEDGMTAGTWYGYDALMKEIDNRELNKSKLKDYFFLWGNYKVQEDSIITHTINRPSLLSPTWFGSEEIYLIIDPQTLKYLSLQYFGHKMHNKESDSLRTYSDVTFIQSNFLPDTDVWLKEKRWFNCEDE